MASNGAEPIGSLGYDGPLAALSPERQNLADYFKETVAVVTNPAIDREREIEHFSTRAVFGRRPSLHAPGSDTRHGRDLVPGDPRRPPRPRAALGLHLPADRPRAPDLPARGPLGGVPRPRRGDRHRAARVRDHARARSSGSSRRPSRRCARAPSCWCSPTAPSTTASAATSTRICATSAVDQALKQFQFGETGEENLRRRCSIVLRSAAIRNVHDVVLALGLGANGVCPYVMVEVICVDDYDTDVSNLCAALAQGDREGDLDDRDPRGPRLRAPVLLDRRSSPSSPRSSRPRPSPRSETGRRRLRRPRRTTPTSASGSSPATRRRSRRRPSASIRRSTRRRSLPPTAPPATTSTRRRSATLERAEPDLDAPHHGPEGPIASRSTRPASTPRSATTTTRS